MNDPVTVERDDLGHLYDMAQQHAENNLWDDEKPEVMALLERVRKIYNGDRKPRPIQSRTKPPAP